MKKRSGEIKNIEYSNRFLRSAKRLPERIFNQIEKKERVFRRNPFSSQLGTHKLHGREKGVWVFSINRSYRIKFIFLREKEVLFLDVGTHKIYI